MGWDREKVKNTFIIGIVTAILLNVVNAGQDVYQAYIFKKYSVAWIVFGSMCLAVLIFHGIYRWRGEYHSVPHLLWLNVLTAGSWGGVFASLSFLPPAVVIATLTASSPIFTFFVNRFLRRTSTSSHTDLVVCVLSALLIVGVFLDKVSVETHSLSIEAGIGIALALLSSLSGALLIVLMKSVNEKGGNLFSLLSHRFYLLVVMSAILALNEGTEALYEQAIWESILIVGVLGVVPSMILLQLSIKLLEPVLLQIMMATTPLLVLFFQYYFYPDSPTVLTVLACIGVTALSIFQVVVEYRRIK